MSVQAPTREIAIGLGCRKGVSGEVITNPDTHHAREATQGHGVGRR